MDLRTWEKIKSELKNAHPLARIRKLHTIIQNPRIPKKIRDEAKELAAKARVELDSEHFWKWGGVSLLPSRRPQLEEQVKEERPKKNLEQTVDTAAPAPKPKEEEMAKGKYTSKLGEEYLSQGYFRDTAYEKETKPVEEERASREEVTATTSEKLTETKYHRKAKANQQSY